MKSSGDWCCCCPEADQSDGGRYDNEDDMDVDLPAPDDCPSSTCRSCCYCCRSVERDVTRLDLHGLSRVLVTRRRRSTSSTNDDKKSSTTPSVISRTVWFVILLLSLAAFIYSTTNCVQSYLQQQQQHDGSDSDDGDNDVVVGKSLNRPTLPPITICNLNPVRLTEAAERHWPVLSRDSDGGLDLTAWNSVNASSFDIFTLGAHQLNKLVVSCQTSSGLSCSQLNFSQTSTEHGICHTLHINNASRVRLTLNVEAYEYTSLASHGVGLRLLVGNNAPGNQVRGHASDRDVILLSPGVNADVTIRHVTNNDVLPPAVSECHVTECISGCQLDVIRRQCGCRPYWIRASDDISTVESCQHCSTACQPRSRRLSGDVTRVSYTFSRLGTASHLTPRPGNTASSWLLGTSLPDSRLASMATDRCQATDARARHCPRTASSDRAVTSRFVDAIGDFADAVDLLRTGLGRAEVDVKAVVDGLAPRMLFHVSVGLAAVRQSFSDGFAESFRSVEERSLGSLVAGGGYDTVANMERTVKQLTFTSVSDAVPRKVLFYVTDNMLSAKLETAIQALDNISKVYYSFVNAEPVSTVTPTTPDRRYDLHLVPYAILTHSHDLLKRSYGGVSENIAGLIEYILALKAILKDVYTTNAINETTFSAVCRNFVYRTQQVRHFTSTFESDVIARSLQLIDTRTDQLRQLNVTLHDRRRHLDRLLRHQRHVIDTNYAHAHSDLVTFVELTTQFASRSPGVAHTSTNTQPTKLTVAEHAVSDVTRAAVASLVTSSEALRAGAEELRSAWRAMAAITSDIWRTFINEDLLRNFYLNLYNDVTDVSTNPTRVDTLRALLTHFRLAAPASSGSGAGGRYQPSDLFPVFNADVPVMDEGVKSAEIADNFKRLEQHTDAELVLGHRDRDVNVAFRSLVDNMKEFYAECQLSADLVSDNIVVANIEMLPDLVLLSSSVQLAYTIFALLGHVGGLLALFLGASLITCLEFVDVVVRCACALVSRQRHPRRRRRRRADRKLPPTGTGNSSSNHVMFRPIESTSDDVTVNHRDSPSKTGTASTPLHHSSTAAPPKVKVNATAFRANNSTGRRQEETDI